MANRGLKYLGFHSPNWMSQLAHTFTERGSKLIDICGLTKSPLQASKAALCMTSTLRKTSSTRSITSNWETLFLKKGKWQRTRNLFWARGQGLGLNSRNGKSRDNWGAITFCRGSQKVHHHVIAWVSLLWKCKLICEGVVYLNFGKISQATWEDHTLLFKSTTLMFILRQAQSQKLYRLYFSYTPPTTWKGKYD